MAKYVGMYWSRGWKGALKLYSFDCKVHGKVVNYPSGHSENLVCPLCIMEMEEKRKEEGEKMSHDASFVEERAALPLDGGVKCRRPERAEDGRNRSVPRGETG